ncbi:uncharacterized protein LOC123292507 [Chrysoperla carnea]|uniref:uncharacterized protein LOC123292507 n=1 Tax=Chrysoperla carnea TaxID=189513 RepID=UPI001D086D77|nr:uncharacterized protein LOC123292507 [Chrysoperla carnea]
MQYFPLIYLLPLLIIRFINILKCNEVSGTIKSIDQDENFLKYLDIRSFKLTKYNKTTMTIHGKIKVFQPLTDIKITFKYYKKMGNGYIQVPLVELNKADLCNIMSMPQFDVYFQDFFKQTDMPYDCKMYPGEYKVFDLRATIPKNMPRGSFRSDCKFFQNDECVGRFQIYLLVE